jgi:4,5-dihydroxyphthalate decarboxylase
MTVKDSVLKQHPWVAKALYDAFVQSKDRYLAALAKIEQPSKRDRQTLRNQQIVGGDPFPMGLKLNRHSLEGMINMYAVQRIIPSPMKVESLFAAETLSL